MCLKNEVYSVNERQQMLESGQNMAGPSSIHVRERDIFI